MKQDKFNFTLFVGHKNVDVIKTTFPAGESCIRINDDTAPYDYPNNLDIIISMDFKDNGDMFDLALLVDAIKRRYATYTYRLQLSIPYLPYARQDRVMVEGESLSVRVVASFINSFKFQRVFCADIHSGVGAALINNLIHRPLSICAQTLPFHVKPENTALVSPDQGAEKKVFDFAKSSGYTKIIRASKERDLSTGKIVATKLLDSVPFKPACTELLIVDDICDGGRTFIELAKVLQQDGSYHGQPISLYVTHGIFSAGLEVFEGFIGKFYVHNLMNDSLDGDERIKII